MGRSFAVRTPELRAAPRGAASGQRPVPSRDAGYGSRASMPTLSHRRLPVSTKPIEDDIDVANERHRVLRGDADNDMLKIENLTKVQQRGGGQETPQSCAV